MSLLRKVNYSEFQCLPPGGQG